MAKISPRHVAHAASACILSAAFVLPTGLTISAAEAQSVNGGHAERAARTTDPPSPTPTPSDPTDEKTSPSSPADTGPSEPTDPTTSPSSTPSGTTDTSEPSDHGDTDEQTTEPPPEQKADIDEATTTLNEEKEKVPQELASTVDKLISIVSAVEDPRTLPQDREAVVESAKNLSTALAAIMDPRTPPELRKELTSIVKQVTSTLETVSDPRMPAEERSMLILVVKRTTSTLDMICDPKTPQGVRGQMITSVKDTTSAVETSHGSQAGSTAASQDSPEATLVAVGASHDIMRDRRTPPKERAQLAAITRQVSALLKKINDSETSKDERSEAEKELKDTSARMKDQQEESASAQERPEESLGKAAAFCTSAIFESTPESALMRGLKKLVPPQWEDEGVKDFWKAKEKSDDALDVLAQLRNNEHTHGSFEVVPLITELAEIVPKDKLFGTLGGSALACKQTATYVEEEYGVTVGSWLTKTGE
ncbi:hypothetical protein [Streptomyces flaveolus]|uniref:hypothetical protein n=1 Tax=Streptomyces flaveolus TaxID=67297 RepID=UPI00166FB6FA|nr:hypothetical protein [Streptomyces flaveolus]GGQ57254.1 hypothetical protein GCM10010216_18590 [Streptomyces flaveolus]